jgi:hypothetical protein
VSDDQPPQRRSIADRLLGATAEPSASKPPRGPEDAPRSVRWAAAVVGLEALAMGVLAVWLLVLTVGGSYTSLRNAVGEIVFVGLAAAALAFVARGLWRVASWSRGPVVAAQILLGLFGFTAAFTYERPLLGLPLLVPVAVTLYLLATPEARLAFFQRR